MDHFVWSFTLVLLQSTFCFRGAEGFLSATVGQDCVLPCSGHPGVTVTSLEWTELEQSKVLLLFRDGRFQDGHPDFTERVQLLEPQLLRGNFSLILKNVTFNDTGIYKCRALYEGKHSSEVISHSLSLTVTEPEAPPPTMETKAGSGLLTGLLTGGLGLLLLSGFIILCLYLKRSKRSQILL